MYSTPFYKRLLRRFGVEIKRVRFGLDPWPDLRLLFEQRSAPLLFDVGANVGQTTLQLRSLLPRATIHAFEPNPSVFDALRKNTAHLTAVSAWNLALGDSPGRLPLQLTGSSLNTSLLHYNRADGTDRVMGAVEVPVETLAAFCASKNISAIDLLKCDAQGFDLQVFRGGDPLFQARKIDAVFCEVMFRQLYEGQCYFEDIHAFLVQRGFKFSGFYDVVREGDLHIHWADALYLLPDRFGKFHGRAA